jgi:hypothetical protein
MKTSTPKKSSTKLVSGFDSLLKSMLTEDLNSYKAQSQYFHSNLQVAAPVRFSA